MSPEAQAIIDIIQSIKPELWYTLAQLTVAALIIILFKKGLQNMAAFLIFKWNKELSKNVIVMYENREMVIMDFNWRYIHLKDLDNGNKIILPMIKSGGYEWEIVREHKKHQSIK